MSADAIQALDCNLNTSEVLEANIGEDVKVGPVNHGRLSVELHIHHVAVWAAKVADIGRVHRVAQVLDDD